MRKIELTDAMRVHLGPEMKMDCHWVDIKLRDGRRFGNLVVRGGRFVTGRAQDPNGEGALPFEAADITAIRRRSVFGKHWPFWPRQR